MYKMEWIICEDEHGMTIKHIALKRAKISASAFRSMKFSGGITLNGNRARADERVCEGDRISFCFNEKSYAPDHKGKTEIKIPWENENYYVIDKPAPLPTVHSAGKGGETLEDALYMHLGCPQGYMFRPVNRLDKGTSGLMVAAKSAHAQQRLQQLLHTDNFVREYMALCDGIPEKEKGEISLPIGKEGEGVKRCIAADGKPAQTFYETVKKGTRNSIVRLRLKTGRTHQIRVHMSAIGCPVTGDYLYGKVHPALEGRFALHSFFVSFTDPITNELVEIESPIPQQWHDLCK